MRVHNFQITIKRVIELANSKNIGFNSMNEAEKVLRKVYDSIDSRIDDVINHFVDEYAKDKNSHIEVSNAVEEVAKEEVEEAEVVELTTNESGEVEEVPVEILSEETKKELAKRAIEGIEIPVEESVEEEVIEKAQKKVKRKIKAKCPVCERGFMTKSKYERHMQYQAKKCHKHAQHIQAFGLK